MLASLVSDPGAVPQVLAVGKHSSREGRHCIVTQLRQ